MFDSENAYSLTNSQPFRSAPAEFPPSASADAAAGATRFGAAVRSAGAEAHGTLGLQQSKLGINLLEMD